VKLFSDNGILLKSRDYRLYLDPSRKIKDEENTYVAISHGHTDHVRNHSAKVLGTQPTFDLVDYDLTGKALEYDETFKFDSTKLTFRNANHVLGSAQTEIETEGQKIVYTGDFKLHNTPFFKPLHISECDTLIIESTFGMPYFRFPTYEEIAAQIKQWVLERLNTNRNIFFGGYALGKSQQIIHILNQMGITPVVHPKIAKKSAVYLKHGVPLHFISSSSEEGKEMMKSPFVGVMPPHLLNPMFFEGMVAQTGRKHYSALATGWAQLYQYAGIDKVFPLSDHADFWQILDYVERTEAKNVYTIFGYDRELAAELRSRLKIHARPFHSIQLSLEEFSL
jgi:putative mRNA 3-end processing factor